MAATDIKLCYAIEDAVHQALGNYLIVGGITATMPIAKEDLGEITTIPLFSVGPSNGHLHKLPTGSYEYDLFPGSSLVVELSVPRFTKDAIVLAGVYSKLAEKLSIIRELFGFRHGNAINDLLAYHALTHLIPRGTQLGFSQERGEDIASITYQCTAGIRPDAWPDS